MSMDIDNPNLTAYVLGELNEKERLEVEAEMEKSQEVRRTVEQIRRTAEQLRERLKQEPAPALTPGQRQGVHRRAGATYNAPFTDTPSRLWRWMKWSVAASILLVFGALTIGFSIQYEMNSARELASADSVKSLLSVEREKGQVLASAMAEGRAVSEAELGYRDFNLDGLKESITIQGDPEQHKAVLGADPSNVETWKMLESRISGRPPTLSTPPIGNLGKGGVPGGGGADASTVVADVSADVVEPLLTLGYAGSGVDAWVPRYDDDPRYPASPDPGPIEYCISRPDPTTVQAVSDALAYYLNRGDQPEETSAESYAPVVDNAFLPVRENPLSTFSIDVDTASYANVRRFLTQGTFPPKDAVRIEEMINYFTYDYPPPAGDVPFSVSVEVADCPWNREHLLARVGLKGREISYEELPPSNFVFLIDVSGSMQPDTKLPLLKQALGLLVEQLDGYDRVAIVVYAGASGLVLPSTPCDQRSAVLDALNNLQAGGSTNGGEGIQLAYDTAMANFIPDGNNRVILCTDGDFNVGVTNLVDLTNLIEAKAKTGVFLSVLGFGMGNFKDTTLEKLADKGNGNYAYIDTLQEANKVLVEQMTGTLVTIAKDVKIQIEFNPAQASAYRLIGYENRILAHRDFDDDAKDAGEIGAGHTVTALYEIVPAGEDAADEDIADENMVDDDMTDEDLDAPAADPFEPESPAESASEPFSQTLMTVKLRYKLPDADESNLMEVPVIDQGLTLAEASGDFVFASAVAAFGMILRDSPYKGDATLDSVAELAEESKGASADVYRGEFVNLVKMARNIRQ